MHKEILTQSQIELLPFIKKFKKNFTLVGGTAIALQIGHRRSIDFDLFTQVESLNMMRIKKAYKGLVNIKKHIIHEAFDQIHFQVGEVKITFFTYPYPIDTELQYEAFFNMPDLLTLSAMKALALGGRAKWKDYVDLYFILKSFHTLEQITQRANEIFGDSFSAKLLRQQLSYFEDIDYSEEVEFMGDEIPKEEIKSFLIDAAVEKF